MSRRVSPGILVAWLALLVCLGLSISQNLDLRERVEGLTDQLARTFEIQPGPAPGELVAFDTRGNEWVAALDAEDNSTTVMMVASGSCPFCEKTMDSWRELATDLGTEANVLPLRLDGHIDEDGTADLNPEAFGPFAFAFPNRPDLEWLLPTDSSIVSYRLRYVPQTIVARAGEIVYVKTGPLGPGDLEEIEAVAQGVSTGTSDPA